MAYRYQKNNNGELDLIFDGFEDGIADSPFKGIGNMRNVNTRYYSGVAYSNYKRKPVTLAGFNRNFTVTIASPAVFTANNHGLAVGNVIKFTTTGALPTGLSVGVNYFVIATGLTTNNFEVSATFNGSAVVTSGSQSGTHTFVTSMAAPAYQCQSPAGIIFISDVAGQIFEQSAVNSSLFNLLMGCPGTPNMGLQYWNGALLAWDSTQLNIFDGSWNTGASTSGVWPIKSATLTLSGTPSAGDTSATLSSYTDAQGNSRAFWNGPSGSYPIRVTQASPYSSQIVFANMTQGSSSINWFPALNAASTSSSVAIQPMQGIYAHPSLVSINDGNCYFGNDTYVGSIGVLPNQTFSKLNMLTYNVNFSALGLPQSEAVIAMTELRNQLLIGSFFKIYPWDRISSSWTNPVPIKEYMYGMINIMNNVYVFAGNKGNIYLTNGYSVNPFKKMPDNIAGCIDPQWQWGGIMSHRQNLFFQALATNSQTGVPVIAGIYSLNLALGTYGAEVAGALTMEAQNSFGLVSPSTTSAGLLIDNNSIALGYDNYYSAWNDVMGGIDYNDTTLWSNGEIVIETDIAPIGTFLQNKTYGSAEFKLDQPMQSGDSISLYGRQSLTDTYTLIGTTNTAVLSFAYQKMPFQSWQWLQLKAVMSCNATSTASSFMPLREIRIR